MSEELTLTIKGFTDEDQVRAFCGWYSDLVLWIILPLFFIVLGVYFENSCN